MNVSRLLHTLLYLKPKQLFFQLRKYVVKPKYVQMPAPIHKIPTMTTSPIARYKGVDGDTFTFINLTYKFENWNYVGNGTLFTYNLNYFDFINADGVTEEEACQWIDRFINDTPAITWGMDPYPIALRGINWIKLFCSHPECATKKREDSLYSQYRLLERKLEYHLLGNHLLEDAFSLTIAGHYFSDERVKRKGMKLLLRELQEQILPDGAHYEQSPMYHCILLDRLLDTYNITKLEELIPYAQRMLGHLESIIYDDGSWPFFGDAAMGIAPIPQYIKGYACRLGILWEALPLKECGYRKMQSKRMEAFVDVGNIMATYQPGHSHADAFNYELKINGKPFIIDTGISTYNKTQRRQYERSTAAHNTVTIDNKDSFEVWGGFRVGSRATVTLLNDTGEMVSALHNGFGSITHKRTFAMKDDVFDITDELSSPSNAISYIHLAPGIEVLSYSNECIVTSMGNIEIEGADKVNIADEKASNAYNQFHDIKRAQIHFNTKLDYCVKIN